jgi:hypothetical protein
MRSIVPAALVLVLEAGFLLSVAALPAPAQRAGAQGSSEVASSQAAPAPAPAAAGATAPAAAPAARPASRS